MADTRTDIKLRKALKMVCQERLLPNLINSMSQQLSSNIKTDYRRITLERYKQQLRIPRPYNPEEGKSKRQLFQEKLQKIINHEIPIDYCGVTIGEDGKKIATYRGRPLDTVPVETKEQFKVFKDFSYDNFIKDKLNVVWDEHAQDRSPSPLYNPYQVEKMIEKRNRIHTVDQSQEVHKTKQSQKQKQKQKQKFKFRSESQLERPKINSQPVKLPTILQIPSIRLRSKTKVQTGRIMCKDENKQIALKFQIIGGYNKLSSQSNFITKQSIVKYLKKYIYKPIRIVDFLEIKPVQSLDSFTLLVKRIKSMPKKHRNFICFLFFDTNNDAIICQNDLLRLRSLAKNPSYLESDYQKLIKTKYQQKMEIPPQFDLYRLPQITQSSYFNFLQKRPEIKTEIDFEKLITQQTFEGDSALLTYKKRYRIDFDKFDKVYRDCKPGLWYLLMDVLGGIRYEGISYFS